MEKFQLHVALDNYAHVRVRGVDVADHVDETKLGGWMADFAGAQHFLLSEEALAFVDDMPEEERKSACVAMIDAGVFRLPYGEVTTQVWHKDRPVLIWLKQVSAAKGEYTVDARMMVRSDDGKWAVIPVDFRVGQAEKSSEFMVWTKAADWVTSSVVASVAADWAAEEAIAYCQALAIDLTALVLLTSTRGVVRTRVEPDKSSVRLAKLRRATPKFSHTVVELNKSLKTLAGKTYTLSGRKIPRIHWRRGHSRTLKSGSQVWVSAHLVGHDDQGRVSHDYSL